MERTKGGSANALKEMAGEQGNAKRSAPLASTPCCFHDLLLPRPLALFPFMLTPLASTPSDIVHSHAHPSRFHALPFVRSPCMPHTDNRERLVQPADRTAIELLMREARIFNDGGQAPSAPPSRAHTRTY